MNTQHLKIALEQHAQTILAFTRAITTEQARWKPNPGSWSILEVINHLYDEEREDFRMRLEVILFHPQDPLPPIRPGEWVTERKYNERDLETSVNNFLAERAKSLAWLDSLQEPNWGTSYKNEFGELRAGDMFAAWVAHDVLHLRQLTELHYALVTREAEPYAVGYAGDW